MNLTVTHLSLAGMQKDCLQIQCSEVLNGQAAPHIRKLVEQYIDVEFPALYINAAGVLESDLSGINEIIHTHYSLLQKEKRLVFIYRRNSVIEKWVHSTGLNKFIETALLPAL